MKNYMTRLSPEDITRIERYRLIRLKAAYQGRDKLVEYLTIRIDDIINRKTMG